MTISLDLYQAIAREPLLLVESSALISDVLARLAQVETAACHLMPSSPSPAPVLQIRPYCVLVMEQGQLAGIVTERDIVRFIAQGHTLTEAIMVAQIMSRPVISRSLEQLRDVFGVLSLLQSHRIRHLPVLDEQGQPIGCITPTTLRQVLRSTDLLRVRLVEEVMQSPVIQAPAQASILAIAQLMLEHRISSVVLTEPGDESWLRPVGILTERDIVQMQALGIDFSTTPAQIVMSYPLATVTPDTSLAVAYNLMQRHYIHRVVVVGPMGDLRGIVTQSSVLKILDPTDLSETLAVLRSRISQLEAEKIALLEQQNQALSLNLDVATQKLTIQTQREQFVNQLIQQLQGNLNLDDILQTTVMALREFIQADRVLVYQFYDDLSSQVVAESVGEGWLRARDYDIYDQCFRNGLNERYLQGWHWAVNDINQVDLTPCHRRLLESFQVRANLVVPLLSSDLAAQAEEFTPVPYVWGLLIVHQCSGPRLWQSEEIELLKYLANQLTVYMQRGRLLDRARWEKEQRQKAQSFLTESEARFRQLADNIEQVFYLNDLATGQVLYVSPSYETIWGRSCQSLYDHPQSFLEQVHPEDCPRVLQAYQEQRQGQGTETQYRILCPDGQLRWILDRCFPVRNGEGQVYRVCGIAEDITTRKTIEIQLQQLNESLETLVQERTQALEDSEKRLELALRSASLGIWEWDVATGILHWDKQMYEVYGVKAQSFQPNYENWLHCIHIEDRAAIEQALHWALAGEQPYDTSFRACWPNGQIRYIQANGLVLRDSHGGPVRMIGVNSDITDKKRAEQVLKQRLIAIEAATDGIAVVNENGRYISINRAHLELFGYQQAEELLGKSWDELYYQAEVQRFKQFIFPLLARQGHWQGEALAKRKDGSTFIEELSLTHVQDIGLICVCRDITFRKEQEQRLLQKAQEESLLRKITERIRQSLQLEDIFATATQDLQQFIQVDRACIFKFDTASHYHQGTFVAEALEPGLSSVLHTSLQDCYFSEHFAALYQVGRYQVINDLETAELEACHRQMLGQLQIRAHLVFPLLCGEQLWGLLCLHQCTDVRTWQTSEIAFVQEIATQLAIALQQATLFQRLQAELQERQRAEGQLREANQKLADSNAELARATRLKDEFLANMSHELRTPLNAILGLSQSLLEKVLGDLSERQQRSIETIERSGEHLLSLINDILDLSKIEANKLDLEPGVVNLARVCQDSLQLVRQLALKKQIRLQQEIPPGEINFMANERRLQQILLNLLNNAVKFTPQGGQVSLRVTQEILEHQAWLIFAVKDTGIGISPEDQGKLFQSFVQVDSSLNRQYEGTGLGLALVRRLAELHGGRVSVESAIGAGSCFRVYLPYRPARLECPLMTDHVSSTNSGGETVTGSKVSSPQESALVLIAEDNPDNIESLKSYLEYKGYRLMFAKDGRQAITMAQQKKPDLILMDIQMPGMDGIVATQEIRALPGMADIPIVALTALAMPGDKERCLAAGMNDYVSKPIRLKALLTTMEKLLCA
ncbi:PAS domain-containing protein [Synechocystis sp. LKSZ1]|uniref:PAS domain-containing protein n=1 Tax=Synechocystis sp. LKSZ1 TaxID=3144951 RepID=UPI00336BE5BB